MTIAEIVEAAGGAKVIANACDLTQAAISHWDSEGKHSRGIPVKHWQTIIDLSKGKVTSQILYNTRKKMRHD